MVNNILESSFGAQERGRQVRDAEYGAWEAREAVVKEIAALTKSAPSAATPQTAGFEATIAAGLLLSSVYIIKRRNS